MRTKTLTKKLPQSKPRITGEAPKAPRHFTGRKVVSAELQQAVKKRKSFCPGTVALREIRKY